MGACESREDGAAGTQHGAGGFVAAHTNVHSVSVPAHSHSATPSVNGAPSASPTVSKAGAESVAAFEIDSSALSEPTRITRTQTDSMTSTNKLRSNSLTLLDANTHRVITLGRAQCHAAQLHTDAVHCVVALTPTMTVSGAADKQLTQYEWNQARTWMKFRGHSKTIDRACITPAKDFLFSGSRDTTIRQYSIALSSDTANERYDIQSFRGHTLPVASLTYNDAQLVSGSRDYSVRWWDVNTGASIRSNVVSGMIVTCGDSRNKIDWVCSADRMIRGWDRRVPAAAVEWTLNDSAQSFAVSADETQAIIGAANNILVYDVRTNTPLHTIHAHNDIVTGTQFVPITAHGASPLMALSVSRDRSIKVWDLHNGNCQSSAAVDAKLPPIFTDFRCISLPTPDDDGDRAISLSHSTSCTLYTGSTGGALHRWRVWSSGRIECIAATKAVNK